MGIEIPPEFGDDCLACYAPGATPTYLWATFEGITKSAEWEPADGELINGVFRLEQHPTIPCYWTLVWADGLIGYWADHPTHQCQLFLWNAVPQGIFLDNDEPDCTKNFTNSYADPHPFEGGTGVVSVTGPTSTAALTELCGLIGQPITPDLRFEFWDIDIVTGVYRMARKPDHTNIKILTDQPLV